MDGLIDWIDGLIDFRVVEELITGRGAAAIIVQQPANVSKRKGVSVCEYVSVHICTYCIYHVMSRS